MEKLKQYIKKTAATLALASALIMPQKSEAGDNTGLFVDFNSGVTYELSPIAKIENIPEEIRQVPDYGNYHNNSGFAETPAIENTGVQPYDRINLVTLKTGVLMSFSEKSRLKAGIGLDFDMEAVTSIKGTPGRKDTATRYNESQSYQETINPMASKTLKPIYKCEDYTLTTTDPANTEYCSVSTEFTGGNWLIRPSLFSELEFDISKDKSLTLGYKVYQENIVAENGWSSEEPETYKAYDLASLIVGSPYASLKFKNFFEGAYASIDFGMQHIISKDFTDLGKEADIKFNDFAFFLGFRLGGEAR